MERAVSTGLLLVMLVGCVLAQKYTTKFDNVNVDEILSNDRLFNKYIQCLLEQTDVHCTPDGRELKKNVPDALLTGCSKCSEKQKEGTEKVIQFLIQNKTDQWKKLEAKYDPQGTYAKKYAEDLKKIKA